MSAIIGKRWTDDRTELHKVLPLDTPYLLFVDPSSLCNFRCKFCPCGGANKEVWSPGKKTSVMSYEIYRRVIDSLKEFPNKIKTLRLYKEGEPLLNKRLPDMISYARKKDVVGKIDFTTNGYLLEHDLALAIMDAGVDRINISVEALDAEKYQEISGVKIDYKKFLENLKFLYQHKNGCHIFIKISDLGLGEHSENEFFDTFSEMCDEMAIEHISSVWPNFEVNDTLKKSEKIDIFGESTEQREERQVCPYLFYSMCVNSDGTISACLMDWNHQLIIGDVREQTLADVWKGNALREMREKHLLLQKGEYQVCGNCGQLKYAVLDNIDDYRREIITKLQRRY